MIFTVTPNPSLDRTLRVSRLTPGAFHRVGTARQDLSGKGINVSRALHALGIPSQIVSLGGGWTGRALREGLQAEGYPVHWVETAEETRQNITLIDEANGQFTKINEPGPEVGEQQLSQLSVLLDELAAPDDLWVFSGSLPPGAPADWYAAAIQQVQARGARAFLDSSGSALQAGLMAQPYGIKPNDEEAAELLNQPVESDEQCVAAAGHLLGMGARLAMISRGEKGLVLAGEEGILLVRPPLVEVDSPIAAGDSALAGLLWGLKEGCSLEVCAARAAACGTAAALQPGSSVGNRALVEQLIGQVQVSWFDPG